MTGQKPDETRCSVSDRCPSRRRLAVARLPSTAHRLHGSPSVNRSSHSSEPDRPDSQRRNNRPTSAKTANKRNISPGYDRTNAGQKPTLRFRQMPVSSPPRRCSSSVNSPPAARITVRQPFVPSFRTRPARHSLLQHRLSSGNSLPQRPSVQGIKSRYRNCQARPPPVLQSPQTPGQGAHRQDLCIFTDKCINLSSKAQIFLPFSVVKHDFRSKNGNF